MSQGRCVDCGGPLPSPFNYCPRGQGGSACRPAGTPRTAPATPETVESLAREVYAAWSECAPLAKLDDEATPTDRHNFQRLCEGMARLGVLLNMNVF